jgi:hypothetical protein
MKNNINIKEFKVLSAIYECAFHNGRAPERRINNPVYIWACDPFDVPREVYKVLKTLAKKGLAGVDNTEEYCWITAKGVAVLQQI